MTAAQVWSVLSIASYAAALAIIVRILLTRREPGSMLVWILTVLLLPILGPILFLLVGESPIRRKARRRRRRRRLIEPDLSRRIAVLSESYNGRAEPTPDERQRDLMALACRLSDSVVTRGNSIDIFHDAERAFLTLGLAIEEARSHVHLEYYIFAEDETGRAMRDLLVKKAREGVEVRLLIDAMGSWSLGRSFVKSLRDEGVQTTFFLPWGLTRRHIQLNCRNHRKLAVIDGRLGFTGSKNIADEYLGRRKRLLGPWRDTHLRLAGPCVTQLQEVFVEDWHFATKQALSSPRYFPSPVLEGPRLVQIIPSGPDRQADVLHQLLNAAVFDARRSVSLLTPYFVPDAPMLLALTSAAYRGVRVRVLLPSRSDHPLLLWAARSFYEQLLEAGVEILEYDHGMLHSKEVIVDGRWAMVGSANMDVRSFAINFELTTMLYDEELAQQLQVEFEGLCDGARRMTIERVKAWSIKQRLAAGVARLATPML